MRLSALLDTLLRRDAALEPRQKGILTLVSVVTMTAPKTFEGPAVFVTPTIIGGGAVFASRTGSQAVATGTDTETNDDGSAETASATKASPASTTAVAPTTLITAASSPLITSSATNGAAASTTTAAASKSSSGMSGGAKAGLAFGIIILIGALLGALLFMYNRKKKQATGERLDDEKAAMPRPDALPAHPEPVPMMATATPRSTDNLNAPRLSLRPVTQFDPKFGDRRSAMGLSAAASVATAGAVVAAQDSRGNLLPQPATLPTVNEKTANDPANPFGNHAETINTPNGSPIVQAGPNAIPMEKMNAPLPAPPKTIDASDFPLPDSAMVSKAPSFISEVPPLSNAPSHLSLVSPPSNSVTSLPMSLQVGDSPVSSGAGSAVAAAGVATAAGVAGAAVVAGAVSAGKAKDNSASSPPPAEIVHRVQLDFKPSMDDELDIRAGQIVRVLHEYDDGWVLCARLDRSQQGVVPRTCLSKNPVKPRPNPNQQQQNRPRGPPPQNRGSPSGPAPFANPVPRPLTPTGRKSPAPFQQAPRSMTPTGRNSPAPYAQPPRAMTPTGNRPRAASNASPYMAYNPQARSMSPGPYGSGQLQTPQRPEPNRRRSNSMGQLSQPQLPAVASPVSAMNSPGPSSPQSHIVSPIGSVITRKPVPGQSPPAGPPAQS
ncbi:hypothetical protein EJ06DRAFT_337759 [Trichodelitschia bisporula]|uniref:SH3 domain-containing protein n=1 Tax=Trichodelitschia bisporula TaxID=703511 RepID=A0A6G1I2V2_9PEZI|nr:hypothetical protein EJ06DRAFT_337759 [Trichodelitschia bisporula]